MEIMQDLFISHVSVDKATYIQPLAESLTRRSVTFWLDSREIAWGDSIALKINDGLRRSRYILLCLSEAFLSRPWPETEMNAALSSQNEKGIKKVLPLILNSKDKILNAYPLIGGLAYREFSIGTEQISAELASLASHQSIPPDSLHVIVESANTGQLSNIQISPRASVQWLAEEARRGAGLKDSLDTGTPSPFRIRWVLIDAAAEDFWKGLSRFERQSIWAVVKTEKGIEISRNRYDRLETIGIYNDIIFHLYAIEDIDSYPRGGGEILYSRR